MIDLEITLAQAFGWSLYDIDQTDIASLLPFVARYAEQKAPKTSAAKPAKEMYCDQIPYL